MPCLPARERGCAIELIMQGFSQSQVARQLGVAQSTMSRLRHRLNETGHLVERPSETTRRQDHTIRMVHLRNRFLTALETAANTHGRPWTTQ